MPRPTMGRRPTRRRCTSSARGCGFWKYDDVPDLIAKRLKSLREIEDIVADAAKRNEAGKLESDRTVKQLALQGPELLKRVAAAREIYEELKLVADRERAIRAAAK